MTQTDSSNHPISVVCEDDLNRSSRATVFFRYLLALPHLVWLALWAVAVVFVLIINWFVTLIKGRSPDGFHKFLSDFLRYQTHVQAYIYLIANPFPGFVGAKGSYPVDIVTAEPTYQNRWKTAFRGLLAIPAFALLNPLNSALSVVGIFGWFVALATKKMPEGLRNLGVFVLRYSAQTNGYLYLLTDRYPYSGPSPTLAVQTAMEEHSPEDAVSGGSAAPVATAPTTAIDPPENRPQDEQ